MKRIALFAVVIAISACSGSEKAPAADSAAAAAATPAPAPAATTPPADSGKGMMMDTTKKDTTKKM